MFQINRRLIVVPTLIISPPLWLGDLLFSPSVNKSIRSQDTEQTPNSDCNFVAKLRKITFNNPKVDLVYSF